MIHMMKLNDEPFTKVIELRLNDEKRRKIGEATITKVY